ncbi:MAG: hypothetical protein ACLSWI_08485 [Candidatus Gastranaerophilaceae bacterium]
MGLITATIRMQYLQQARLDLEYKIQLITQTKIGLSQSTDDLMQVGNDYDPESPITKMLNQRQAKLKALEQKLDSQLLQYQNRLKMIDAEYNSCKEMFSKNLQTLGYYN